MRKITSNATIIKQVKIKERFAESGSTVGSHAK